LKNKKIFLIIGTILLCFILIIFLQSAITIGNATSTLSVKTKNVAQLTGVRITNPEDNGMAFYYGTPINFTAEPIFSGQQIAYPGNPKYLCRWSLFTDPNQQGQVLNPYPVIDNCSVTITPGQNGIVYDSDLTVMVEAMTSVNGVETIKTDSRRFNIVANPGNPLNNIENQR